MKTFTTRNFLQRLAWSLCGTAILAAFATLPMKAEAQTNQLINPGMETGDFTGWTTYSAVTWDYSVSSQGASASCPGAPNPCNPTPTHSGNYSFFLFGDYAGANQYDGMYQDITNVVTQSGQTNSIAAGNVFSADTWAYSFGDDYCFQNGQNQIWLEVTFRDATRQQILALYRSAATWPADGWVHLQVTNQFDPNTLALIGTGSNLIAPGSTAVVRYQIVFHQVNYGGGSSFWDDNALNYVSATSPAPVLSAISPNGTTLSTNQFLTCSAAAASGNTISQVQLTLTTSPFGSTVNTTNNITLTNNSAVISGIGTGTATFNYPLTANTVYHVAQITATDNLNLAGHASAKAFDTFAPALVIDASDFNFSGGQFIDTPPNGGLALYSNQVGNASVDENKNPGSGSQANKGYYRPTDAVIVGNANPSTMIEQKFAIASANGDTVDQPEEVGYNSPGDWLDYSRTYGPGGSAPAGTYNMYLYMTTDGGGIQTSMSLVTSDPAQGNQTTNFVGNIGTPSFSYADGSWAAYEYVPMVDQFGNLASVTLNTGVQTLRSTVVNNPNIGFYALVPATPVLTPVIQNLYPDGTHPFEFATNFTMTIGPANGSNILGSGIGMTVNGLSVTASPSFKLTQAGGSWTINYPVNSNSIYSIVVSVTNTGGKSSVFSDSFDTFDPNNYQWEAVDYDFSTNNGSGWISGLFIDNPVPTCDVNAPQVGEMATNSYFDYPTGFTPGVDPQQDGAVAQQTIDINFPNDGQTAPANEVYRNDGVGSQPATDYVRSKFLAAQTEFGDPNIGPINVGYYGGGYWMNYTRHWPTNNYYIWGRLAGGNGPFSGTTASLVTNGYGTSTQQTSLLGTFADPAASGWQAWHWVQMLDGSGKPGVVSLGGQETLKITSGGNVNAEFYMLVQAPPMFKVTPALVGGQLQLSFPTTVGYNYMVLYKGNLLAPTWTPLGSAIPGTGNTQTAYESLTGSPAFYEVMAVKSN